jgi:hypothetical protein
VIDLEAALGCKIELRKAGGRFSANVVYRDGLLGPYAAAADSRDDCLQMLLQSIIRGSDGSDFPVDWDEFLAKVAFAGERSN